MTILLPIMIKLFAIMLLGYLINKGNILDSHTNQKLSLFIVNITAPLLIITSVLNADTNNKLSVLVLIAGGILMYTVFVILAKVFTKVLKLPKQDKSAYECMIVFSNSAFMGYPVVQSIFGTEAIFHTSMIHFAFNIFVYTFGINSFKPKTSTNEKITLKQILNPGLIICIIAIFIYVSGFRLDGVVYDTLYMVGDLTSALSMIVLGSTLAQYPLKKPLMDLRCYGFSLIRLIIIPVLSYFVCRLLHINDYYTSIITITNGMPVATFVLMLAAQNNSKSTELVTGNILVSTLLANITIPILGTILF